MRPEDLTPEDRDRVQIILLKRWLELTCRPKGTRRRTDHQVAVKRFDMTGRERREA